MFKEKMLELNQSLHIIPIPTILLKIYNTAPFFLLSLSYYLSGEDVACPHHLNSYDSRGLGS
jgi:hypothetical protein